MTEERITCRGFDITIKRYLDATIITFHSINVNLLKKRFYFRASNHWVIQVHPAYVELNLDAGLNFPEMILLPKEVMVRIESDGRFVNRMICIKEFVTKYPAVIDPRPEWT